MARSCIFVLLVGFLFASCAGPKKTTGVNDASAPTKADRIIVTTDLTPTKAYRRVGQVFQDQGFSIAESDESLLSVTTEQKESQDIMSAANVTLSASVREGSDSTKVVLTGTWSNEKEFATSGKTIRKYGNSGSAPRKAWKQMHLVAEELPGKISYEKSR
jgi:hypothetical protein